MDYETLKREAGADPHDLADAIQSSSLPPEERVRLLFEAFDDQPDYGILMYLTHEFASGDPGLRRSILGRFLHYLSGDDPKIAHEILYTLWCDYFENPDTVEEAWRYLAGVGRPPVVLERLLPVAGPVPWSLKVELLESLVPQHRWHPYIFRCLFASQFDVFGSIDPVAARRLLLRLDIAKDEEGYLKLKAKLAEVVAGGVV